MHPKYALPVTPEKSLSTTVKTMSELRMRIDMAEKVSVHVTRIGYVRVTKRAIRESLAHLPEDTNVHALYRLIEKELMIG